MLGIDGQAMNEPIFTNYWLQLLNQEILGTLVVRNGAIADGATIAEFLTTLDAAKEAHHHLAKLNGESNDPIYPLRLPRRPIGRAD